MAMQCPECHKFTSVGEVEVALSNVQANGDLVTGDVEVTLKCAHCSADFAQQEFPVEMAASCCDAPDLQTQDEDAEPYEGEMNTGTEKKPKLAASYGADVKVGVHCIHCETYFDLEDRVESVLSEYEPLA